MTGTGELGTHDLEAKIARLLERSEAAARSSETSQRLMEAMGSNLSNLVNLIHKMDTDRLTDREALNTRSEINKQDIGTLRQMQQEETRQRIAVDNQQVEMLREEKTEREKAAAERKIVHDKDITDLRADIKEVADALEKIESKIADTLTTNRIILFLAGVLVVAVIGGIVTGRLGLVVRP